MALVWFYTTQHNTMEAPKTRQESKGKGKGKGNGKGKRDGCYSAKHIRQMEAIRAKK
jgi:hypothetical protein